ncbi:hypothetical protein OIV19_21670 [Brucella sp. HL-2]|nr:hypothetical protein [Brucella sp. HL-2]MCV9910206.1 hypothetical protein [Brucella sp. HL-2]
MAQVLDSMVKNVAYTVGVDFATLGGCAMCIIDEQGKILFLDQKEWLIDSSQA